MTTILLPETLSAANSKELLQNCKKQLCTGALTLDGSQLKTMDYSADAFFALLAELAEKTGNRLTLSHFNEDIKAHLSALRKMDPPDRPVKGTNNVLEILGGLGFTFIKEFVEVLILLFMSIYWTI
nr:STAS domain-containing protein [Fibrobacter sp.]